ncbi:glycoside hydrolase family 16 protein [Lacinutrix cladophorae]
MKNIKYIITLFFSLVFLVSCEEENYQFGDLTAPTNLQVSAEIIGQDTANPFGDGSGNVNFTATADNAITYRYSYNGDQEIAPNGELAYAFSNLGINTYTVTVIAIGPGGNSTSATIEVEVLATYSAPADLLAILHGNESKTWRVKSEKAGHFGLGPVGGAPTEWYAAGPSEKAATGMYDDRYVFHSDGTFTHVTNSVNDDPTEDVTGTIFGRVGLVEELGPHNETPNGDDIENYPYSDYSENWTLTAPGGNETINLSGLGFIGYYTGGSHSYEIYDRSVANELLLRTTDGNNGFDWWFIITSEEEETGTELELVWSDEFDTNGTPNPANWTYDLGAGGWGNQELQTYTDNAENVIVDNGSLIITAKANGSGYTSARLKSEGLQSFTYGKMEIRAKLPASQGTWPAIWMLGSNFSTVGWPTCGEIDIMEQTGWDKNISLGTCHWLDSGSGTNASYGETTAIANAATEFHVYSLDWSEQSVKISVDDVPFMTLTNSSNLPFNADFFFILNIAMGGTLGGDIDPAFTEDTMEIDYVRVYQ